MMMFDDQMCRLSYVERTDVRRAMSRFSYHLRS